MYVALHGTYLLWWFLHQRLSPTWGPTVFPEGDLPLAGIAFVFLAVGPGKQCVLFFVACVCLCVQGACSFP